MVDALRGVRLLLGDRGALDGGRHSTALLGQALN